MIELKNFSTKPPTHLTKENVKKERNDLLDELEKLQNLLVAESKQSLLIVLQGMDASGKDGLVRKVFRELKKNLPMILFGEHIKLLLKKG